jgi:2-C-methyl-D-erythritol 2,4-cyclodiphosphate synthase
VSRRRGGLRPNLEIECGREHGLRPVYESVFPGVGWGQRGGSGTGGLPPLARELRVGIGYDLHAFVDGRPLVLGGVEVPHPRGLRGHSDADVLTHAVIDALLGAAALGTIGEHFPDTDPRYAGVSSLVLLDETVRLVAEAGYRVVNVDSVITAQEPRLQPHLGTMASTLAGRLGVEASRVGVKATSPEGLGAMGRREGIAAQAVALLETSE